MRKLQMLACSHALVRQVHHDKGMELAAQRGRCKAHMVEVTRFTWFVLRFGFF